MKLLCAGRISPEKGIDTLIEAMITLVSMGGRTDIRLTVAGAGSADYENQLRQLVNQAGLAENVLFLGWISPSDMPGLLTEFDALVLPSIWPEPLSRSVLEGMASGLVVLAARTGGTPEIIVDGENGLLFTPNDPNELAKKIADLSEDPELRAQLGKAGRQTVLERFTVTKMMDEIESYLEQVASTQAAKETSHLELVQSVG